MLSYAKRLHIATWRYCAERSTSKKASSGHSTGRINAAMGKKRWSRKAKMIGHLRSILNLREGRKIVTIYGGYAMAIKRNLSHSGAAAMVATLGGEEERGRPQEQGCRHQV